MIDVESIAKDALRVASGIVAGINPLAGMVVQWAGDTAFEIVDQQRANADPIAAAELAGDRAIDLVQKLRNAR